MTQWAGQHARLFTLLFMYLCDWLNQSEISQFNKKKHTTWLVLSDKIVSTQTDLTGIFSSFISIIIINRVPLVSCVWCTLNTNVASKYSLCVKIRHSTLVFYQVGAFVRKSDIMFNGVWQLGQNLLLNSIPTCVWTLNRVTDLSKFIRTPSSYLF